MAEKLESATDVKAAKKRMKLNPIMNKNTFFLNFLAWWVITLIFVYVGMISFMKVPVDNKTYVTFALGSIFGAGFTQVLNWAFRTAKGAMEEKNTEAQIKHLNGNKGGTV